MPAPYYTPKADRLAAELDAELEQIRLNAEDYEEAAADFVDAGCPADRAETLDAMFNALEARKAAIWGPDHG